MVFEKKMKITMGYSLPNHKLNQGCWKTGTGTYVRFTIIEPLRYILSNIYNFSRTVRILIIVFCPRGDKMLTGVPRK